MTRNHYALTRVWAAELDPRGVTVNAVAPGLVDAAMLRAATARKGEEAVKGMVARTPLGYWASDRHYWRIGTLN